MDVPGLNGGENMINRNKLGLLFGVFSGACHLVWSLLVLMGLAQPLMDWIFRIHFIQPPYAIQPFNFGYAIALILFTTVVGYVSGWMLAALWNWLRIDVTTQIPLTVVDSRQHATGH